VLMRSVLSSIYVVVLQNSQVFVLPLFIQPHRAQRLGIHSLNSPSKNFDTEIYLNLFFRKLSFLLNRRKKPKGHIFRQNVRKGTRSFRVFNSTLVVEKRFFCRGGVYRSTSCPTLTKVIRILRGV
jgi:hypothetical protein